MMLDKEDFFVIFFGGFLISTAFFIVLWHILHFILCRKYDEILFKEPTFNQAELAIYNSWPLSLVRSMAYILLIASPDFFITKRRFKEVSIERSNISLQVLSCKIFLSSLLLSLFFLLIILVSVVFPELFSEFISS